MKLRFVVILALLMLVGCGGEEEPLSSLFPQAVGDMELAQLVQGPEAMRAVNDLHGKDIEVEDAVVATYRIPGGDQGQDTAMVWVSRHGNPADAREQAAIMIEKMLHPLGGVEPVFHDPEEFRSGGSNIYRFHGMGLVHLVFQRQDRVYWIAAPEDADGQSPSGLLLDAMLAE